MTKRKALLLGAVSVPLIGVLCCVWFIFNARRPCKLEEPDVVSGRLEKFVDKSLLTGEPCAPPCWQGITPGTTPGTEAVEILKGLEFVDPDSIRRGEYSKGERVTWEMIFGGDEIAYMWFDSNGIVDAIGYDLRYRITLQELIDAIGDPDGVMTCLYLAPPDSFATPDCWTVSVVWLEQGLTVYVAAVPMSDENPARVQPNLVISRAGYSSPVSSSQEYTGNDGCMDSDFVAWEGFDE